MAGCSTFALYLLTGNLLHEANASPQVIASVSFSVVVAINYVVQRFWVFRDERPTLDTLPKFLVKTGVGYTVNITAMTMMMPVMPLIEAQIAAACAVIVSNAFFAFFWVFARTQSGEVAPEG